MKKLSQFFPLCWFSLYFFEEIERNITTFTKNCFEDWFYVVFYAIFLQFFIQFVDFKNFGDKI